MKSFKIVLLFVTIVFFSGCEKIFHPEEENISKIKNYDDLLAAADGVYGLFQGSIGYLEMANIKGDDINIGSYVYENDFNSGNCWKTTYIDRNHYTWEEWNNSQPTATWQSLYQIIVSINNIISQYDIEGISDKPSCELIGEMYLLRAYCYFRLVRTYGEIPIIDNIDVDYSVHKSPFIEIYKFINSDLVKAMSLLPSGNADARIPYVSPNRGTAKAMEAELYLNWAGYPIKDKSKYSLAAQTAKEVIDSASFFGFALLEDYGYLWDKAHLYNTESIFSIYFVDPLVYDGARIFRWESPQYSGFPYGGSCYKDEWSGTFLIPGLSITINSSPAEIKFYHDFPVGYRKEITFYTNYWVKNVNYYADIDTFYVTSIDSANYRIDSTSTCGRTAFRKFYYDPYIFNYYVYYSPYDTTFYDIESSYMGQPRVYIYKYSHTLLTYAEASARSGELNNEAYEYVNQIRRRAKHLNIYAPSEFDLQPGLSPDAFADSVVWERAWEYAGELEGRWFDLIRLEKVEDLPKLRDPYENGPPAYPITKGVYYFQIPTSDIILNPNLGN